MGSGRHHFHLRGLLMPSCPPSPALANPVPMPIFTVAAGRELGRQPAQRSLPAGTDISEAESQWRAPLCGGEILKWHSAYQFL